MKSFWSVLTLSVISLFFSSCSKDDELSGGSVTAGRSFSLAVPSVSRTLATALHVSENGNHVYIKTEGSISNSFFRSSDGGKTFTEMNSFPSNYHIISVDNNGSFITTSNQIFKSDGTQIFPNLSGYNFILGDNGRIFAYSQSLHIQSKDPDEDNFDPITVPALTGQYQHFIKAPGKGMALVDRFGPLAGDVAVTVHVLNEQTLAWTDYDLAINSNTINGCNNLNRFMGYQMMYNNILIVKGCSGFAVCDLDNESIRYVDFPDVNTAIYTDLRDNPMHMDDEGNIYLSYATYGASAIQQIYQYDGTGWKPLADYIPYSGAGSVFQAQHNTVFYNSSITSGASIKGLVKWDVSSGKKTPIDLPQVSVNIQDAVALNNNELLVVADNELYHYVKGTAQLSRYDDLTKISHVNVLSDGRWIAGGTDKAYLSSDNGKTWALHEQIFSKSGGNSMSVNESRIVNGKLLVVGTYAYKYNNLSTGMEVDKFDNIAVEFNGSSWTNAQYQFPSDCRIACISPEGTIYGNVIWMNSFNYQFESQQYHIMPGISPQSTNESIPEVITEKSEQIVIRTTKEGNSYEVYTRPGETGEWKSTGSKFTPPVPYGDIRLSMGTSGILTLLFHSEVYTLE